MLRTVPALTLFVACTTPGAPSATNDGGAPAPPAPLAATPSAPGASSSAGAPSASASASGAPAVADPSVGAPCAADADCRWDDPCVPRRCIGGRAEPTGCDKSLPPPGACACVARQCTQKPDRPPPATSPCEPGGCVTDRAAGACIADTRGVAPGLRAQRPVEAGPSCDCLTPAKGCEMTWIDRVPCKTTRDCWISPTPRTHPVARPAKLKGRDFKPCSDGEVAPVCGDDGFCAVGNAYKC
jgi:hypothetical protein